MSLLVINGHSNAGKSTFVRLLADTYGVNAVDADHDYSLGGLRDAWETFLSGDTSALLSAVATRRAPTVLDWPYRHDGCLPLVQRLLAAQVPVWWFDADDERGRESFLKRGQGDIADYDAQVAWISPRRHQLRLIYGARWLVTLPATGERMPSESIVARIYGVDRLRWLTR